VIPVWAADDLSVDKSLIGLSGSATRVVKIFVPQRIHHSEMLNGELNQQVDTLFDRLRENRVV